MKKEMKREFKALAKRMIESIMRPSPLLEMLKKNKPKNMNPYPVYPEIKIGGKK